MRRAGGAIILALSACGYPLTQFAIHTVRFGIYLRPDQGRRKTQPDASPALRRTMQPDISLMLASPVMPGGQHRAVPGYARW